MEEQIPPNENEPANPGESSGKTRAEKRQAKRLAKESTGNREMVKKVGKILLGVLIVIVVGWGIIYLSKQGGPTGEDRSQGYAIVGRDHIPTGSDRPQYNSNPPTSGPHYAESAREGVYRRELPDEQLVHNLEHGDIWISYKPSVSDSIKEELKQFAERHDKMIITSRAGNDTDIAVAAWGRLDTFNLEEGVLDVQRVEDFITRYVNRGPEQVPAASHINE